MSNGEISAPSLTESERARILLEEKYRLEVRAALETAQPASRGNRALALLNQPIVLWLLTTVFVSGLSWSYAEFQAASEKSAKHVARVRSVQVDLEHQVEMELTDERVEAADDRITFSPDFKIENPLYPEDGGRTLASLAIEFEALCAPAAREAEIKADLYKLSTKSLIVLKYKRPLDSQSDWTAVARDLIGARDAWVAKLSEVAESCTDDRQ
jgi:hypothetical protein